MTDIQPGQSADGAQSDHIRQDVTFILYKETGDSEIDAQLSYRQDEPYTMNITFFLQAEHQIEWYFARELLTAGLFTCAGLGDVRINPTFNKQNSTTITLNNSIHCVMLTTSTTTLSEFLDATYRLVPDGQESKHLDIDHLLNQILTPDTGKSFD